MCEIHGFFFPFFLVENDFLDDRDEGKNHFFPPFSPQKTIEVGNFFGRSYSDDDNLSQAMSFSGRTVAGSIIIAENAK